MAFLPSSNRAMKRIALVLLATALLGGCAGRAGSGSNDSGIEGTVVSGPHCPVERADSPCPDQPVEATVVVSATNGDVVAKTKSDRGGRFRVAAEPGTYTLTVEALTGIRFAKPVTVTVRPGAFAHATVLVDTGIRVPEPAPG
jgi:hypothetical protein